MKPLLLALLFLPMLVHAQIINTIAGNGTAGYSGDGAAATAAELYFPSGVAVDDTGNVYIADEVNNVLREISTKGIITTIAGRYSSMGYAGDGGFAINAKLNLPTSLAIDDTGNLYFVDLSNNCVRKIDRKGIITTCYRYGDILQPEYVTVDHKGNLFISSPFEYLVCKVTPDGTETIYAGLSAYRYGFSGDGGLATSARLYEPYGMAVDGNGNLYIADKLNYRIRKVSPLGIISTIAGTGLDTNTGDGGLAKAASIRQPISLVIDNSDNLYVADYIGQIRKISATGYITTIAGRDDLGYSGDGGPAIDALFSTPAEMAIDSSGNFYISDEFNNRIRIINYCSVTSISASPKNMEVAAMSSASFSMADKLSFASYQWQENDGTGFRNLAYGGIYSGTNTKTLSISIAYPSMNNYQYRCLQTKSICADTTATAKLIIGPLDIATINKSNIIISPNPAHDEITITAPFAIEKIEIIDMLGNNVINKYANAKQNIINLQNVPAGNYFIRINKQCIQKIVKE